MCRIVEESLDKEEINVFNLILASDDILNMLDQDEYSDDSEDSDDDDDYYPEDFEDDYEHTYDDSNDETNEEDSVVYSDDSNLNNPDFVCPANESIASTNNSFYISNIFDIE